MLSEGRGRGYVSTYHSFTRSTTNFVERTSRIRAGPRPRLEPVTVTADDGSRPVPLSNGAERPNRGDDWKASKKKSWTPSRSRPKGRPLCAPPANACSTLSTHRPPQSTLTHFARGFRRFWARWRRHHASHSISLPEVRLGRWATSCQLARSW